MQATFRPILEGMGGRVNRAAGSARFDRLDPASARTAQAGQSGRIRAAAARWHERPVRHTRARWTPARPPISRGGAIIHEVGTIRMGNDPQTSPLNRFCQAHEVKNLFVADAAPFVSNADKNPTHTIVALAWRTAEYLAEDMRKTNV